MTDCNHLYNIRDLSIRGWICRRCGHEKSDGQFIKEGVIPTWSFRKLSPTPIPEEEFNKLKQLWSE